jgi:hypothetical protein
MNTKTCTKCKRKKSLKDFWREKRSKDGRQSQCKACKTKYNRRYYQKNKKQYCKNRRIWNHKNEEVIYRRKIRKLFGITTEQYEMLLTTQNNRCAICKKKETRIRYLKKGEKQ